MKRHVRAAGFGVQSPSAYRFLTEVLKAKNPSVPFPYMEGGDGPVRLAGACFRIAFDMKPGTCLNKTHSHLVRLYLSAACPNCRMAAENDEKKIKSADMIVADARSLCSDTEETDKLLSMVPQKGCLVVDRINRNNDCRKWWNRVVADTRTVQTFDLYDIGVVFFNKGRSKENFEVLY